MLHKINPPRNWREPASSVAFILAGAVLAGAIAAVLPGCVAEGTGSTTESGVVAGRLYEGEERPAAGAKVILIPADRIPSPILRKTAADPQAVADADGSYRFTGVPAGTYTLSAAGVDPSTGAAYRDSLVVPAAGLDAGSDTLRPTGSLAGRVLLEGGDDARTVLILVLGTNTLTVPGDTSGRFSLTGLAEGRYRVRFLSTIAAYRPLDTVFTIRSGGTDSLTAPLRLPYTGIPAIVGLQAVWNATVQAVDLTWLPVDTARVAGYNVYRARKGSPLGSQPINPSPLIVPAYRDSSVELGKEYAYAVKGVDHNGNTGLAFSETAFASAEKEYVLSKTLVPEAWNPDPAPLAVAGGEIYWLSNDKVEVLDTAQGKILRSFGNSGADSLLVGAAIRILRDTVYVLDVLGASFNRPKFGGVELKRYTRAGAYLGKVYLDAVFAEGGLADGADIQLGPDGSVLLTNGQMIYALRPGGGIDSVVSPLDEGLFRNLFAKLETAGDSILIQGSYRQMPGDIRKTQWAWLGADLSVKSKGAGEYFLNAYAAMEDGTRWEIRDDSLALRIGADGVVMRRIRLAETLYRDIQMDDGVLYIFNSAEQAVEIHRKR